MTLIVAFAAGFIRGFTGFGGPAFMLAMLTWIYTPLLVVGKILLIEFAAACYMVVRVWRDIAWRITLAVAIPTLLTMPLGRWILEHADPVLMRQLIAGTTAVSCLVMLVGFRYKEKLGLPASILLGLIGGIIFGASYLALPVVAVILMGPYNKTEIRALIVSWGFATAIWFLIISIIAGSTEWSDVVNVIPAAVAYFTGTWLGSRYFDFAAEHLYQRVAILTLMFLSILGILL